MKNEITIEKLNELVQKYVILRNDETENHTEWAYVMLEPDLIKNEEVTLSYLMQISKDEFDVLGEDHFFETILRKFKSVKILNVILSQYAKFYGEDTSTPFYQDSIKGLHHYLIKSTK